MPRLVRENRRLLLFVQNANLGAVRTWLRRNVTDHFHRPVSLSPCKHSSPSELDRSTISPPNESHGMLTKRNTLAGRQGRTTLTGTACVMFRASDGTSYRDGVPGNRNKRYKETSPTCKSTGSNKLFLQLESRFFVWYGRTTRDAHQPIKRPESR